MDIKLLMLFALGAVSAASKSHWELTSQDNKIYSGDIKFQMTLSQSWECAKACNKYGFCSLPGYHVEPALGKCIKFYRNRLTWIDASEECPKYGASLLRLDKQEHVLGWQLYGDDWYWWIGGRDFGVDNDRDWKWENGITVDDSQWSTAYFRSEKKCIEIRKNHEGLFPYSCQSTQPYICQE